MLTLLETGEKRAEKRRMRAPQQYQTAKVQKCQNTKVEKRNNTNNKSAQKYKSAEKVGDSGGGGRGA